MQVYRDSGWQLLQHHVTDLFPCHEAVPVLVNPCTTVAMKVGCSVTTVWRLQYGQGRWMTSGKT